MTSLQELCPIDLSHPDQPGTLVVHYDELMVAMRDYMANQVDGVTAVYLALLKRRPHLAEYTAWNIAQRSVLAQCVHDAAGWPGDPLTGAAAHLRIEEQPLLGLTDTLLSAVSLHQLKKAQYQIEENPDD